MGSWLVCASLGHRAILTTRVTFYRVRPVRLLTRVRGSMVKNRMLGVPISTGTLLVKPDMSFSEVVPVVATTREANIGWSVRQASFAISNRAMKDFIFIWCSLNHCLRDGFNPWFSIEISPPPVWKIL